MKSQKHVSGCNAGTVPITAWVVKFRVNDCCQKEIITADTEIEAEAIVEREYALLGLRIEIVDVCRAFRKDEFMQRSIRRNRANWDIVQSQYA